MNVWAYGLIPAVAYLQLGLMSAMWSHILTILHLSCIVYSLSYITDINECLSGINTCSPYADCSNTDGGYICTCQTGYSGDGYYCGESLSYVLSYTVVRTIVRVSGTVFRTPVSVLDGLNVTSALSVIGI